MAVSKTDKPSNVTNLHDEAPAIAPKPPVPAFRFLDDDDTGPELAILGASPKLGNLVKPEQGSDQSGKPKIIFWIGRGKTGKTTGIRWMAERAIRNGAVMLMADMDPTNDTFSKYIENVARPSEPSDPALALKWLDKLLQHALHHKTTLLVDLGGGDTTLRRLVSQLPDLVSLFEASGFSVELFYTVGPQEEDLSPLATMEGLGFKPTTTAIILNQGLVEVGEAPETAFARILRHSAFNAAMNRDAIAVWMPKLLVAQQVEIRRLHFQAAADGDIGQGKTPLGPFDRARVQSWLQGMETSFSGIATWLP